MNSRLLYAIPYLLIGIWSLHDWKKYKNRSNLWFFWCSAAGFIAEIVYYLLISFQASQNILSVAKSFFSLFDPLLIVLVIAIGITASFGKHDSGT